MPVLLVRYFHRETTSAETYEVRILQTRACQSDALELQEVKCQGCNGGDCDTAAHGS